MSQYEAFKAQAAEALTNRDFEKAKEIWQQAIEAEPENPEPYVDLGNVYHDTRCFNQAEALYQKALILQPDSWRAYNNLGSVALRKNDPESAQQYFNKAMELTQDHYILLTNMIYVHLKLKNDSTALACYYQAIAISPHDCKAQVALGNLYYTLPDWTHNVEMLDKNRILSSKETTPYKYLFLANAYLQKVTLFHQEGDTKKALQYYQSAIELFPKNENTWIAMSSACGILKEFQIGLNITRKALEIFPEHDYLLYLYATHLWMSDQKKEAFRYIQRAISLSPQCPGYHARLAIMLFQDNVKQDKGFYTFFSKALKKLKLDPRYNRILKEIKLTYQYRDAPPQYNFSVTYKGIIFILEKCEEKKLARIFRETGLLSNLKAH